MSDFRHSSHSKSFQIKCGFADGHVNAQSVLKLLQKGMVSGMSINNPGTMDEDQCVPCLKGKQHCTIIPTESEVENPRVLHRTYSDVCGPMETTARRGY